MIFQNRLVKTLANDHLLMTSFVFHLVIISLISELESGTTSEEET